MIACTDWAIDIWGKGGGKGRGGEDRGRGKGGKRGGDGREGMRRGGERVKVEGWADGGRGNQSVQKALGLPHSYPVGNIGITHVVGISYTRALRLLLGLMQRAHA